MVVVSTTCDARVHESSPAGSRTTFVPPPGEDNTTFTKLCMSMIHGEKSSVTLSNEYITTTISSHTCYFHNFVGPACSSILIDLKSCLDFVERGPDPYLDLRLAPNLVPHLAAGHLYINNMK